MRIAIFSGLVTICLLSSTRVLAQQATGTIAPPAPLTQAAVAFDAEGQPVIEATLRTTNLNGSADTPVTNTRVVLKNVGREFYNFVSGHVTFYDSSNVRCGEGIVSTGAFAPDESVETDTPGIRVTCQPANWRIVATNLIPRSLESPKVNYLSRGPGGNFVISIDGEDHPIQLGRPMVLTLADRPRTIVVRMAP